MDYELIQQKLSYWFDNTALLEQALNSSENQELEFYGDEVLDFYVSKIFSERFGKVDGKYISDKDEHYLTVTKSSLVDNKNLANIFDSWNIMDTTGMEVKQKGDCVEALVGAAAIDCKWNVESLENVVSFILELDKGFTNGFILKNDYIGLLQNWWQFRFKTEPPYKYENDEEHKCSLKFSFRDESATFETTGKNNQESRFECAKQCYEFIKEHKFEISMRDFVPTKEEFTLDDAERVLNTLEGKCFIPKVTYEEQDDEKYDTNGDPIWKCKCKIEDLKIEEECKSNNKKIAKKESAYKAVCYLMGWTI